MKLDSTDSVYGPLVVFIDYDDKLVVCLVGKTPKSFLQHRTRHCKSISSFAVQKLSSSFVHRAVHINAGLTEFSTAERAASLVAAWQCG